jgi:hypothetical protein
MQGASRFILLAKYSANTHSMKEVQGVLGRAIRLPNSKCVQERELGMPEHSLPLVHTSMSTTI